MRNHQYDKFAVTRAPFPQKMLEGSSVTKETCRLTLWAKRAMNNRPK